MKTASRQTPEPRTRTRPEPAVETHEHPIPWHEMGGLSLIGLGFYLAWCYLYPLESGAWGQGIGLALWQSGGEGGLVPCALLAMWGVRIGFPQVLRSARVLEWTLVALLELLVLDVVCWLMADAGGSVGRSLGLASVAVVGRVGTWLLVTATGIFSVLVWRRLAPSRLVGHAAARLATLRDHLLKMRQQWARPSPPEAGDEAPDNTPVHHEVAERESPPAGEIASLPQGLTDAPAGSATPAPPAEDDDSPPWDEPTVETRSAPAQPRPSAPEPVRVSAAGSMPSVAPPRPGMNSAEPGWDLRTQLQTDYRIPPVELLNRTEPTGQQPQKDHSRMLMETLQSFGVSATVVNAVRGPTVTRYELAPARGVKVSSITNLSNDIALALAAQAIRLEAPIPGKSAIGIEVPNERPEMVGLRDILESSEYRKATGLPLALGRDIAGRVVVTDLLKAPHLLIAGSTGSGKSVCLNTIIASMLFRASPLEVQMVMVDIKRVELSIFEGIPHLAATSPNPQQRIVTDAKAGTLALKTITDIMMQRYDTFTQVRVRNIGEYNRKVDSPLPFLVVIIDELAELMQVSARAVEGYIQRIAQMGRAAGLHLILATQRPSVDVITGTIKANFPARIAFAVKSQVDSRTILDRGGADKLLGRGDMLFSPTGSETFRVQGAYVDISEMERVIDFWKGQAAPENLTGIATDTLTLPEESLPPEDEDDEMDEDLVQEALKVIRLTRLASASNLQRRMKLGYPKAGRLMDVLEKRGYVGPADGSKPRKMLFLEGADE